nr:hypothetical protein [uncultured Agathobacter sp.]
MNIKDEKKKQVVDNEDIEIQNTDISIDKEEENSGVSYEIVIG